MHDVLERVPVRNADTCQLKFAKSSADDAFPNRVVQKSVDIAMHGTTQPHRVEVQDQPPTGSSAVQCTGIAASFSSGFKKLDELLWGVMLNKSIDKSFNGFHDILWSSTRVSEHPAVTNGPALVHVDGMGTV